VRAIHSRWPAALAALLCMMVAGCSDSPVGRVPGSGRAPIGPETDAAGAGARDPTAEARVPLRIVEGRQFPDVLRQYRGKVVLVDFWATWCLVCLEEFPHTVALHDRYGGRGLAVISVSLNEAAEEPRVLEHLRSNGATFENLLSRDGMSDAALQGFGLANGVLPQYRLYDREGNLRMAFPQGTEPYDAADIERAVEQLLSER